MRDMREKFHQVPPPGVYAFGPEAVESIQLRQAGRLSRPGLSPNPFIYRQGGRGAEREGPPGRYVLGPDFGV
jgi:hypothetical protein